MSPLSRILHDQISASPNQRLPFADVMEQALYHPDHGYYGPGPRRIGRSGDFYTAVSVGPLYGRLLVALAKQIQQQMGATSGFCLIEQAAHDGQLAEDILSASDFDYVVVEPNPRYEVIQRQRLAAFGHRVRWVSSTDDLPADPALFLCNELPDAMPVHRVQWDGQAWQELFVSRAGDGFAFTSGPLSRPELAQEAARLPTDLPSGYSTEINLAALDWLRKLATTPFQGAIFIADYGFDHDELYAPERPSGTLRRYRAHQMDDHLLEDLGECDLTSHVNFTRLIETATEAGLRLREYAHQGRFLGKLGLDWLRELDGQPPDSTTQALLRQYHSLTHPAFMGRSFRVALFDKP